MSSGNDSVIARALVERKLCTSDEVELVRSESRALAQKKQPTSFADLLVQRGYVTRSQLARLNQSMDEDSMYRPAQQIPGYQILSKIGQGAMAVVFKAKQLSLDRIVAIKVLPKRLSENPEFVERFYREGRAAAKLNHPNIVAAYDVGEAGGYHYFVMEFIDGKTVYDLLTNGRRLDEQTAIRYALQCSKALHHAHQVGLIHRDVKPKNIMITQASEVKLADMGLAREMSDYETATAEAGRAYGTPYYISPEQIRGAIHIDARADIYSLGATFYHMVTGKVPFEGPSPSAVMHKHLKETLIPPDHVIPSLSSGIGEIIEVMMAKVPDDRYPSMSEVIEDLQSVAEGKAPFHARQTYDQKLLEQLANTGEIVSTPEDDGQNGSEEDKGAPIALVFVLGLLLAASLIVNLILLVTR